MAIYLNEPEQQMSKIMNISTLAKKTSLSIGMVFFANTNIALASAAESQNPDLSGLDIITVVGVKQTKHIAGAVTYIAPEILKIQNYTDINRILRAVPGMNLQEEDGFGLRPNIGMRGSGTDRSSKVLILEDGVPMAPAPFSAPAAYYFPRVARMHAVEVTKGTGAVKYGPITTAGAIQFFSTPIPEKTAAHVTALTSDLGRTSLHTWAGGRLKSDTLPIEIGVLLETYQDKADGFKQIDIGETGFSLADYVAKLGFYAKDGAQFEQQLILKYQSSAEISNETYLGLTASDFERNPFYRYAASQIDQMNADHKTYQATHNIKFSDAVQLTTLAYRTEFARNWEKLDRFDNSSLSGSSSCDSLNEILVAPTICEQELQVLTGPQGYTSPDDVLGIRQNNRTYYTQGIQTALGVKFGTGELAHNLVVSARYHEDAVDRFQEQDQYRIENGIVVKTTDNEPGTQANRLSNSKSLAVYAEDVIAIGPWNVTIGLRYEDIKSQQLRWSSPERNIAPSSVRANANNVFLPSFGVVFDISDHLSVLAGAYRGFALPSVSARTAENEVSTSFETGGRYNNDIFQMEAIGFFNDYKNLIAACTNSSGGSECVIGDSDNAGAARVYGLEFTAKTDFAINMDGLSLPVNLVYSYTGTELLNTVNSAIYGNVTAGDEIPYVPVHQLTLNTGFIKSNWGINATLNYVSEARNVPGQSAIPNDQLVEARTLADIAAYYDLRDGVRLHLKADNVFDTVYIAGRRPYGVRPGKPREIFAGISLDF